MRSRWTGHSEAAPDATTDELKDGLKKLEQLVLSKNSHSRFDRVTLDFTSFVTDSGYECLAEGSRCQGDCRDTIYAKATLVIAETLCNLTHVPCKPAYRSELTEDPRDSLYVVGVNHQKVGHALYSSLTMYNFPRLASALLLPEGASQGQYTLMDKDYGHTGKHFLPEHPAAKYLYVVKFARKCAADEFGFCVEVPSKSSSPDDITMSLQDQLVFIERMYIEPSTKSGPSVAETILPRLLHFVPRFGQDQILV